METQTLSYRQASRIALGMDKAEPHTIFTISNHKGVEYINDVSATAIIFIPLLNLREFVNRR